MMTKFRPISYESLKNIVQCFEPNFRFHLTLRCPSLKRLHPSAPLEINYLRLGAPPFQVNNIIYKIGIIRHYTNTNGDSPDWVERENEQGGVVYDVEEYGDPQRQEVKERKLRSDKMSKKDYEIMRKVKARLKKVYKEMRICKNDQDFASKLELKEKLNTKMLEYQAKIVTRKWEYCHYFVLTSLKNRKRKTLGIAEYDKPLELARQYFDQKFFPNEVKVKYLNIEKWESEVQFLLSQRTLGVYRLTVQDFTGFLLSNVTTHKINN